jgi:DNA-binding MarR family transcriptional regulator
MAASTDRSRALWDELVRAQTVAVPLVHKIVHRRHGLSLTELAVLRALLAAPGGQATMSDLQQAVHLSAAGTTRVASGLERRALVSRDRRDGDRRLLHAQVTADGRRLAQEAQSTVDELLMHWLGRSLPDADIAAATAVLTHVAAAAAAATPGDRARTSATAAVRRL